MLSEKYQQCCGSRPGVGRVVVVTSTCTAMWHAAADASLLHSTQRHVESVEDVVSWDQVVARYIQLQGGQPDTCDHQ